MEKESTEKGAGGLSQWDKVALAGTDMAEAEGSGRQGHLLRERAGGWQWRKGLRRGWWRLKYLPWGVCQGVTRGEKGFPGSVKGPLILNTRSCDSYSSVPAHVVLFGKCDSND